VKPWIGAALLGLGCARFPLRDVPPGTALRLPEDLGQHPWAQTEW
jgi:hypothetical protein